MTLNDFLNTAIISHLLFLIVLTLSKKSNTPIGYRFLFVLFLLLTFIFTDDLLESTYLYKEFPVLPIVFQPVLYAFAPIIYFAVTYLTSVGKKLYPKLIIHLIPYLVVLSLYILEFQPHSVLSSNPQKESLNTDTLLQIIFLLLFFIQIGCYLFLSVRQLKRHKHILPLYVSNISGNDFGWLYKTIIGLSLIVAASFFEVIFDQMHISSYFSIFYLLGFYYIGVQISKQNEVFPFSAEQWEGISDLINEQGLVDKIKIENGEESVYKTEVKAVNNKLSERKKVIGEEKLGEYKTQLLNLMKNEKPYLDSEITLPKLGKLLQLNSYQTSYLINYCFGENFYNFVNRYRLEACKKMLLDNNYSHLSILGIAFEAGFNSKTAFNTSFKKQTGISPKNFIAQNIPLKQQKKGSDLSTP